MRPTHNPARDLRTVSRLRRAAAALVVGLAAATALNLAAPSPASAATAWPSHSSYTHSNFTNYSNVRACASTSCGVTAVLYNDSTVWMLCWVDGGWATGNYSSNRWFYVWWGAGQGYVHSSLVFNQASSPNCNA